MKHKNLFSHPLKIFQALYNKEIDKYIDEYIYLVVYHLWFSPSFSWPIYVFNTLFNWQIKFNLFDIQFWVLTNAQLYNITTDLFLSKFARQMHSSKITKTALSILHIATVSTDKNRNTTTSILKMGKPILIYKGKES